jgi:3-oxoadipyl-CoA thiolase
MTPGVVVVEAVRTPMGKYGGALRNVRPDDLAAIVLREVVRRSSIDPATIDDVYIGCSNQAGEDNRNVARMATLLAGFPHSVPGATINRLCGSGLEAINDAARVILVGEGDALVAGGVESMTRAPLVALKPDSGFSRGGLELVDSTIGWRFVNPRFPSDYPPYSMGETAENLAQKYKIPRAAQDEFALASHKKAIDATDSGRFGEEIVPVATGQNQKATADEGPRRDTSIEKLAALKPAFRQGGSVTAGNSSGISDGAAALLLMSEDAAAKRGMRPIVRVLGSATAGVHPSYMGMGPVYSTRKLLQRLGMQMNEFGIVELNEAFSAQVLACIEEMPEFELKRMNPNGGAIALGHPLGCSGARLVTTLVHQMKRTRTKHGMATMCIGVGQGISTAFELVS